MPENIEISELVESGSDGGGHLGFYCKGHVDKQAFAEAANRESGASTHYDRRWAHPGNVKHLYYRTVKIEGDPGEYEFIESEKGRGAWKATVVSPISDAMSDRTKEDRLLRKNSSAMGARRGIWFAIEQAYRSGGIDAALALTAAWNEEPATDVEEQIKASQVMDFHNRGIWKNHGHLRPVRHP